MHFAEANGYPKHNQKPRRIQRHTRRFRMWKECRNAFDGFWAAKTSRQPLNHLKHWEMFSRSPKIGREKNSWEALCTKWPAELAHLRMFGRAREIGNLRRGPEHKPGTKGNVNSAIKQHAKTGDDIQPNYTNILEKGANSKTKDYCYNLCIFFRQILRQRFISPAKSSFFSEEDRRRRSKI